MVERPGIRGVFGLEKRNIFAGQSILVLSLGFNNGKQSAVA